MNLTGIHCYDSLLVSPEDVGPLDHVFTDPPYSPRVHKLATTSAKGGGYGTSHNDLGFDHLSFDLQIQIAKFVAHARLWSLVYTDWEGLSNWITAVETAGGTYIRAIPWVRWSTPQKTGDRPVQGSECLAVFWGSGKGSKRPHWYGPGNMVELEHECYLEELDALRHKCLRGSGKHKTEKPLDQALDLVNWFSAPGESIFDPTTGSGTFGLGAQLLWREFLGFEINATWAAAAAGRLVTPFERDITRVDRWLASNPYRLERPAVVRKAREIRLGGADVEGDDGRDCPEGMF